MILIHKCNNSVTSFTDFNILKNLHETTYTPKFCNIKIRGKTLVLKHFFLMPNLKRFFKINFL